jgi:hypothetical protein
MHAITAGRERQVGTVVHQESDAALLRHRPQRIDGAPDRVVVGVFEAELDRRDVAGVERCGELLGEGRRLEARWRDEIKSGQASPL